MTDEQLKICIEKFQKGENEVFSYIYEEFFEKIYRYVFFRVQHRETVEDLVSSIFFKASQNLKKYEVSKAKFSTWIYTIAKNTIIDHWKTAKAHEDLSGTEHIADTKVDNVDHAMKLEEVRKFLDTLPGATRDIVIMRVWDGLSHAEIALVLQQSEASVKMKYSRAIQKIREKFGVEALFILVSFMALK